MLLAAVVETSSRVAATTKRLEKIAQGPNNSSKEWLREFLKECDDVPEKLALEKSFANQLPQSTKQR